MHKGDILPVLIVGAGPTGLTLAVELARRGVPFRLIDAADGPFNGSRGKGTQPRSLEIFDDLGVIDEVLAGGRLNMPLRLYDAKGGYVDQTMHEHKAPQPDVPYPVPLMIAQWRVEGILRKRLDALGGRIEFGVGLECLTQDEAAVQAVLSHGAESETCEAAWLVGCDGGKSVTRHELGVSFIGETVETYRMMVGDVKATGLDREFWHLWRNEHGFAGLAPLPGTDSYQLQASVGVDDPTEPSLALFQQIVEARTGRSDIRLADPTWMSYWRANVRMVERYRVGRVFLAGDAAHVHTPAGGQGMNTGIQDAYNLGWKLACVTRGADAALLDSYESERLPVAAWMLGLSSKLYQVMAEKQGFGQRRDSETLQLGINYRTSDLAQDLRAASGAPADRLQAGDRAPDAPGLIGQEGTRRMFDLLRGTHFTLLAFGQGWGGVIEQAERTCGAFVKTALFDGTAWIDSAKHAACAYGIERDTLVLIRPDGYVGFFTEEKSGEPLMRYLARFVVQQD